MTIIRHTPTVEEREEQRMIEDSLKVSSYADKVLESLHTGRPPQINVPDYRVPTRGEVLSRSQGSDISLPHESDGVAMDFNALYDSATANMSENNIKMAANQAYGPESGNLRGNIQSSEPQRPRMEATKNQAIAIRKFPVLIDFLGRPEGEKIARAVSHQINEVLADYIQKNSKQANEFALICKADKQNFHQYFKGENWLCKVTAAGPFRGDEAIYYSREEDLACILRKSTEGDQVKYADVTEQFNIIYEAEEGTTETPSPIESEGEKNEEHDESVRKATETMDEPTVAEFQPVSAEESSEDHG